MELIIADFVTHVTTTSTNILRFSIAEIPLSLRVLLKEGGRELTEDEKLRIPLISQTIAACRSRASIDFAYHYEIEIEGDAFKGFKLLDSQLEVTLGSESKDLFDMFVSDIGVTPSAFVKIKTWENETFSRLMSTEVHQELLDEGEGSRFILDNKIIKTVLLTCCKYNAPTEVPVHVKILVHFPESVATLKDRPPARRILEEGLHSDVIIVAANGAEIKAHRSFLGVHSPVLRATFQTDMEESKTSRIDMSDATEPGIRAFLRHIYYEDLSGPKEDADIVFQVLYLAHKYLVGGLETQALECLIEKKNEEFNVEAAFNLYMFIRNLESESAVQLKMKTIQILIGKIDELLELQKYRDLFENPSNANTAMQIFKDFAKPIPL